MGKAKTAALVFGSVTTCIFGGLLAVYSVSPVAGSVSPEKTVYNIENDEIANAAALTSVRTITVSHTESRTAVLADLSEYAFSAAEDFEKIAEYVVYNAEEYSHADDAYKDFRVHNTDSEKHGHRKPVSENAEKSLKTEETATADTKNINPDVNNEASETKEKIHETKTAPTEKINTAETENVKTPETAPETAPAAEPVIVTTATEAAVTTAEPVVATTEAVTTVTETETTATETVTTVATKRSEIIKQTAAAIKAAVTTETTAAETTTAKPVTTTFKTTAAAATTETTTAKTTSTQTTTSTTTATSTTTTTTTTVPTTTTVAFTTEPPKEETAPAPSHGGYENFFDENSNTYTDNSESTPEPVQAEPVQNTLPVSQEDYILLCNAVAHEAGSNWISDYNKALVVEVIMNRVNSPLYPNTVKEVLSQPYQFTGASGYVYLSSYSSEVNDGVISGVDLYFSDPSSFSHGYLNFYGDGYQNHFS